MRVPGYHKMAALIVIRASTLLALRLLNGNAIGQPKEASQFNRLKQRQCKGNPHPNS